VRGSQGRPHDPNALGNPEAFHLTGGQAHDLEGSDVFLPQVQAPT